MGMNGIIRINTYYINTHFLTGNISNVCSDPRCDSGEPDDGIPLWLNLISNSGLIPVTFKEGDYAYSKGNGNRRRLLCLVCAHHQTYVTKEEMIPRLHEIEGLKH